MSLFHKAQWYFNESQKVEFYSDSFLKIFIKSEGELKDKSFDFLRFVHPEDLETYQKELKNFYESLVAERSSLFNHSPYRLVVDGEIHYLQEEKNLIKKGSHNFLISSLYFDCTELYSCLIRQQKFINEAFDGVWEWLPNSGEVIFSDRLLNFLGLSEQTTQPSLKYWLSLIHPDDSENFLLTFQNYMDKGEGNFSTETRLKNSLGNWLSVRIRGAIVETDESGVPTRVSVSITEIT